MSETDNNGNSISSLSGADVTALVTLFSNMLHAMEGRLIAKMDDNSRLAIERWAKHDLDSERIQNAWTEKFIGLEKRLDDHLVIANAHFTKERDEDLVSEARVKPVLTAVQYLAKNWRTILLVIVSIIAILGFSGETLNKLLGYLN